MTRWLQNGKERESEWDLLEIVGKIVVLVVKDCFLILFKVGVGPSKPMFQNTFAQDFSEQKIS